MQEWTASGNEWTGRTGWLLLAHLVNRDGSLSDAALKDYLQIIERDIHNSKNRTKDAMNSALIAIGSHRKALRKRALAVARAIGKVQVDHGETNCKTPDAESYIKKIVERQKAKSTT